MKLTPSMAIAFANDMFKKQQNLLSLWQILSEHFYPERADFTMTRNIGSELADSLVDSTPVLLRRDMGNSFEAMLRQGDWFSIGVEGEDADHAGKSWLEWATIRQRGYINNRLSNFKRATKEGDHDFTTFGQCVLSVELNQERKGVLYRSWHLRDCAWIDDENGNVGGVARKWSPRAMDLKKLFPKSAHANVIKAAEKEPFKEFPCYHLCIPSELYGDEEISKRFKFVSVYIDKANEHVMEAYGQRYLGYVVPRFQTISGSPYAYSPATVIALPDARTLQAMTHTLLEAAERYTRPPIIATQKVVRGDIDLSPDGITWVDDAYDEKMGASLRTLSQDRGGYPIGRDARDGVVAILRSAFFVDKLSLPEVRDMTAYEVAERMKQFRREVLPLFSPIESEYNGQICDLTFNILMDNGLLGSPFDVPESLQGRDIKFKFVSPLSESQEEEKINRFQIVSSMLKQSAEFDQGVIENVNFDTAFRDAVLGSKAPTSWLHSEESVKETRIMNARQKDELEQAAIIREQASAAAMGAQAEMAQAQVQ